MTLYPDLWNALAAEFYPGDVKTRKQGGRDLSYITARTAMNRFDDVLGPENWWDDYRPNGETSIICALSIVLPDGRTLTKQDAGGAAGMSDAGDDDKSTFSDAFKRAAVKFGVGRYLYQDGQTFHEGPVGIEVWADLQPPGRLNGERLLAWVAERSAAEETDLGQYLREWATRRTLGPVERWPGATVAEALVAVAGRIQRWRALRTAARSTPTVATEPSPDAGAEPFRMAQ